MSLCQATCDEPPLWRRHSPFAKASGDKHFTEMETRDRSDERRSARGKGEPGGRADDAVEFADASELNRLGREERRRDRGAVAERAQPVTEHAVFGSGWLRGGCETRVVIAVLVDRERCVLVVIVGRVPAAQRARQDEED